MTLPGSLQGRLLTLVLGALLLLWSAAVAFTWVDACHELNELLDAHLAQAAALLVVQQAGELDDDDGQVNAPLLHRFAPKAAFQVCHEGRLALRSSNAPAEPMSPQAAGFVTRTIAGTPWRVFGARGAERDVQVFVGEPLDSRAHILWAVLRSMLAPMAVVLPLLAVALWWAMRRGLQPLRVLGAAIAGRAPDSLAPMATALPPAEMRPLVDALDRLFARIGSLLDGERRFTADAAHELRTPLAAFRAQAQAAQGATDDASHEHALQAALAGCDRAARLVDQLLTLPRLGADVESERTQVDLAAVARASLADLAPAAPARGQDIELDAPAPCPVRGQALLLGVLLRNLVDNAIRYSPDGARIAVCLQQRAGEVVLNVDDSGPGLIDADRARLGERFFRVLGSGQSGSGLGWSIVRRIAGAHGATIDVGRSAALGGLAVTLRLPAPPA